MPTYVAFLRAVNIRPRWVRMKRLRDLLPAHGFTGVETYIQSGNVLVSTRLRSAETLQTTLHDLLSAEFGFDIPVVVRTPAQLSLLVAEVDARPSPLSPHARIYVALADGPIEGPAAGVLDAWDVDGERAKVLGSDVILWLDVPAHAARLTNVRMEKATRRVMTTRDAKVVRALAERWNR